MTGKLQIAILSAAIAAGSAGFDKAVDAVSNNSYLLYAAGRYKVFVGDADSALRLLSKAESACGAHRTVYPVPSSQAHVRTCARATKG